MLALWQQAALDLEDRKEPARVSSVRLDELPPWQLFWPEDPPVTDPFLRDLIASRPVRRLRHVGFLGAIDYLIRGNGHEPHRRRHNRFDHSVNVALLAMRYATLRSLGHEKTRVLAAAALLHDIGHGPLSHTLEPVFKELFHVDHHQATLAVVNGSSPLGRSIPDIFARYGVSLEEVTALLAGANEGPHAFLFDSPMNFDTIEAIARCCLFCGSRHIVEPTRFVDAIATEDDFPTEIADRFWRIKGSVYQTLIFGSRGLIADTLAQQYMMQRAGEFSAADFYIDDAGLRRKHPTLFSVLACIRRHAFPEDEWEITFDLDASIEAHTRQFIINESTSIKSPYDLRARYTQCRTSHFRPLRSIMAQGAEAHKKT